MRYIRTKDGKLFDIEKIKRDIKSNGKLGYYTNYKWQKLAVNKELNEIQLNWTCTHTDTGETKLHGVYLNCDSVEYKESNMVEKLCDAFVCEQYIIFINCDKTKKMEYEFAGELCAWKPITQNMINNGIYGAVWTEWGLKYVAKLDKKGKWKIL